MSHDEKLAARVREVLSARSDVEEKKMFGGLCFMVRVGPEQFAKTLAQPHVRPMDFTGRPSKGMVYVGAAGLKTRAALSKWVQRGVEFAVSVPSKKRT